MGCIVKVINNGYEHPLALKGLIKYILTDKDTKGNTRYYDGCYINPENVEREMMDVKQYFRKTQGRQARHFIVSFDDYVCMGRQADHLARQICEYYYNTFQIMYSVHEDTDNYHIHFVMNTVSWVDGHMFSEGPAELQQFKNYVNNPYNTFVKEQRRNEIIYG